MFKFNYEIDSQFKFIATTMSHFYFCILIFIFFKLLNMKNSIIIFNIAFLLFGNLLFPNIHFFHHHDHDNHSNDHTFEYNECIDCITFDENNNYVLNNIEFNSSNRNSNEAILNPIITIESNIYKKYHSRAPPIS